MITEEFVDITPTPRVLRILGDIPFATWNCLAELMDNSFDAFASANEAGAPVEDPQILVSWSKSSCSAKEREIVFEDNGNGMSLETLQKAAKAGYSSNDPIHNLGLFGMGFNIATARLGDETTFLSATKDSDEWIGIKISFDELTTSGRFSAPVVHEEKISPDEHGTRIIVRKLRDGIWSELSNPSKENGIRRRLGAIYSTILRDSSVSVFVQGKPLVAQKYCVWGKDRVVKHRDYGEVPAIIDIDENLGDEYFDPEHNRYITRAEYADADEGDRKRYIKRSRRIRGWVGIQRFSHPTMFGIDFIRNGRKILTADRTIFEFENPETGTLIPEYPLELGTTVGGRIVGEIHVDYLVPTYQKADFDRTDVAWALTREALRGIGPILPKRRDALGFTDLNMSPIGRLVNAYRQNYPGTKCLFVRNAVSKAYYEKFLKGDPQFQSDGEWFKAAQEEDRAKSDAKDEGGTATTVGTVDPSVEGFGPDDPVAPQPSIAATTQATSPATTQPTPGAATQPPKASTDVPLSGAAFFNDLKSRSEKVEAMTMKYKWGSSSGIEVTVWKVVRGDIRPGGVRQPCYFNHESVYADFFFDTTHPSISDYPITPKQFLLVALAGFFSIRDRIDLLTAFLGLIENSSQDERLNQEALRERGFAVLSTIKNRMPDLLQGDFPRVKQIIKDVPYEEEKLVSNLINENNALVREYNNTGVEAYRALAYVPDETVPRIIEKIPEAFMDGKLFDSEYSSLQIGGEEATKRLRKQVVDNILSYLTDVLFLVDGARTAKKQELIRCSESIGLLEGLFA